MVMRVTTIFFAFLANVSLSGAANAIAITVDPGNVGEGLGVIEFSLTEATDIVELSFSNGKFLSLEAGGGFGGTNGWDLLIVGPFNEAGIAPFSVSASITNGFTGETGFAIGDPRVVAFHPDTIVDVTEITIEETLSAVVFFGAGDYQLFVSNNNILGRIRINQTEDPSEIPLPAALPFFIAGLGGLAFAWRRKRAA